MDQSVSSLFESFDHPKLPLKNRIVMSPMTRYFSSEGVPGNDVADYYERRATGGVGLIISEGAFIDRSAARNANNIPDYKKETIGNWRKILDRVHAAGGKMAPQLWHTGAQPDFNFPEQAESFDLEGPSGLRGPHNPNGRVMSTEDIADTIASFARGFALAKQSGFDAVEFHGAHGYLFDQFFWHETNKRDDVYGGVTLGERARFAAEAVRAARAAVGEDYPIIFRLSQWKVGAYEAKMASNPIELDEWVGPLVDAGVDIFDCSQRRFWEPEFEGSDLNFAGWIKKITGKATMTVGSVGLSTDLMTDFETGAVSEPVLSTIRDVATRLARGEFDLVAVGRAMLADAGWPNKVRDGRFDDLTGYSTGMMNTLR